mgnify:FL=1
MDRNQQAKWWLAHERSCRCEICGAGIWLKQLMQLQAVPDYLVLYHKDGDKGNYNLDNISLRCTWCAKYSGIGKSAFKKKKKRVNRKHGHSGSVWYNNGLMSKFIKPREVMIFEMMGWKKGRAIYKMTPPPNHAGKLRITNGVHNRWVKADESVPDGWWRGKANFIARYDSSSLYR